MDFNRIDLAPLLPGAGCVWQGGAVDVAIATLPGPLAIVNMDRGEANEQFIDHQAVEAVLSVWIDDSPDAVLKDEILIALVDGALALLKSGVNLYVHCAAGVSRASYFDIALHMRALRIGYDAAFNLVHAQRPVINPNPGFVAHLRRLEPQLMAAA